MVYFRGKKGEGGVSKVELGLGPIKITKRRPNIGDVTNEVKNVKRSVRKMQNAEELKYLDTYLNAGAMTTTPTLTLLNGMTLGDTVNQRDANQITPTSIQFRAYLVADPTYYDTDIMWRHIILWDSQANGAAPTAGDILDTAVINAYVLAPYKREYQKRYKIIYDKVGVLKPRVVDLANAANQYVSDVSISKKKRQLNRIVKYRNAQNSGTIVDIGSNSLYSFWVSSVANGFTAFCGYRMYFKDD